MTTTRRLWLAIGALTALLVVLGVTLVVLQRSIEEQVNVAHPRSVMTRRMETDIVDYALSVLQYVGSGDEGARQKADTDAATVVEGQARYGALSTTVRHRELSAQLAILWEEYYALGQRLMDGRNLQSTREELDRFGALRVGLERFLEETFQREAAGAYDEQTASTLRTLNAVLILAVFLSAVGVATALVTGWAASRGILRGEKQLLDEKAFWDALLANLPGIVVLFDDQGKTLRWNLAFQQVIGAAASEISGRAALDFIPQDEGEVIQGSMKTVFERGNASMEGHLLSKDGRKTPYLFSGVRFVAGGRIHLLVIGMDISDRKRLEAQLRQSQKMEAVGQLAGGIAHDFHNLLTVVAGNNEILMSDFSPGDPRTALLEEVRLASDRAASLIGQLLAFSRKQLLEPKALNLNDVVKHIETMLLRVIGEDVQLAVALDPGISAVRADPHQLEQVIVNLAVNARDAMPAGGSLTIETRDVHLDEAFCRHHDGCRPGDYVLLSVTDTGHGMTPDIMAHVFEPFFTTKETGKGTGLGLATSYGIVKQSDGYITVSSEPGQGTSFKVYLPRVHETVVSARPAAPGVANSPTGSETLLLVEDEDSVRRFAQTILQRCGYTVLAAAGGQEAASLVESHQGPIHLLISDVVMPSMGGRLVAEHVAVLKPGIKVLFVSGYTDDAVVRHGIVQEETAFLQKPFSASQLAQKVRDVLSA